MIKDENTGTLAECRQLLDFKPKPVDLEEQRKIAAREVAFRKGVYAKRIHNGQMSVEEAKRQINGMMAIHQTIIELMDKENPKLL